jgi:hypothetical protein
MKTSAYSVSVETFIPVLQTLASLLDKGAQHAAAKKFEMSVLLNARLAPDMFPLYRQVQIACDQAKNSTALLLGEQVLRVEHPAESLEELKARIARTIDYLQSVREDAFAAAEERDIVLPLINNLVLDMKGGHFVRAWALPQFYFHIVTAYNILRHNGVELGKRDFMSHIGSSIHPAQPADAPKS